MQHYAIMLDGLMFATGAGGRYTNDDFYSDIESD